MNFCLFTLILFLTLLLEINKTIEPSVMKTILLWSILNSLEICYAAVFFTGSQYQFKDFQADIYLQIAI